VLVSNAHSLLLVLDPIHVAVLLSADRILNAAAIQGATHGKRLASVEVLEESFSRDGREGPHGSLSLRYGVSSGSPRLLKLVPLGRCVL
jgi:hypothetical protein